MKRRMDIILVIAMMLVLLIPLCFFDLKKGQVSLVENRNLAELENISNGISNYMISIDHYVNDRIGFRDECLKVYNNYNYKMLRGNHSQVMVGEAGWLFFKEDIPDYTGTNIDCAKIQRQISTIKKINEWCKERGIIFVLAIGPNKSTIYNEYMVDTVKKADASSLDYIVPLLREEGIKVSYPKQGLIEHKKDKELYYKLDTHWNAYGSKYMFDEIVRMLELPERDFEYTESLIETGDLKNMLGISAGGSRSLEVKVTPNPTTKIIERDGTKHLYIDSKNTKKVICYRDSFHGAMLDYYGYYFYGDVYRRFDIDFQYVEQEKPQYLILSCVERFFDVAISANANIPY